MIEAILWVLVVKGVVTTLIIWEMMKRIKVLEDK
tara:strand:- start:25452 stop:25553 length:102 start_codon:yes stop_codon:yes gene_type:complete